MKEALGDNAERLLEEGRSMRSGEAVELAVCSLLE
jgi:hypothetical protein